MKSEKIQLLTLEYGGIYGKSHSERILRLIESIGENMEYNRDVVWTAAFLHDWGGYTKWKLDGTEHTERSGEVARAFLLTEGYPEAFVNHVVECILNHHNGKEDKSVEAKLLSDADALDFLGTIGVLRDFATKLRDMRAAYETSQRRREKLSQILFFDTSKKIAEDRMQRMDRIYTEFEEESFGSF